MREHNYAILLAGGKGTRFWPQSRVNSPKQFLPLYTAERVASRSLFEQTLTRLKNVVAPSHIFIATLGIYQKTIKQLIAAYNIPAGNIVCELSSKNTAPSIGCAVRLIHLRDPHSRVCVLPCDHYISAPSKFARLLKNAFSLCDENLIIFGVPPTRAATGYGYIKVKPYSRNKDIYEVEAFLEKPDIKTAKRLIRSKNYFWNSGMFVATSKIFLEEFKSHVPGLYTQLMSMKKTLDIRRIWNKLPAISFDYAVMEKAKRIMMLSAGSIGWSDLGSWAACDELLPKDREGNFFKGAYVDMHSRNTTVLGNTRVIATVGLEDVIIVDTPDALLITRKNRSEEVKQIVDLLKTSHRNIL